MPIKANELQCDPSKYCTYHQDHDHDTTQCHYLKSLVEGAYWNEEVEIISKKTKKRDGGGTKQ